MNETELESMIVRLIGDGSQYQQMLKDAAEQTKATAEQVEHNSSKIESFTGNLEAYAGKALKVVGMLGIGVGFWQVFEKADQVEDSIRRLNAAVEANDGIVSKVVPEYKKFASGMADTTTIGKGQVLTLLRVAESFGVSGDAAQKAARDALALSAATDVDAQSAIALTQAVAKGSEEEQQRYSRYIRQLRGVQTEEERMEKYNRLVAAGLKIMAERADDASGRLETMEHVAGQLTAKIGTILTDAINPAIKHLHEWVSAFDKLDPAIKDNVARVILLTAALGPAIYILKLASGEVMLLVSGFRALLALNLGQSMVDITMRLWNMQAAIAANARAMTALRFGAYMAVAGGLILVADAMLDGRTRARELGAELQRTADIMNRFEAATSRAHASTLESVDQTRGPAYMQSIQKTMQEAEKKQKELEAERAMLAEELSKVDTTINTINRNLPGGLGSEAKRDYETAKANLDHVTNLLNKQNALIAELHKRKGEFDKGMAGNPKTTEELRSLISTLEEERETFAMTARQAQLYKASLAGVSDKQSDLLEQARQLTEEGDERDRIKAAQDAVDDFVKSLRQEAETIGMSESEQKLYSLAKQGATEAMLAEARALAELKDGMAEENRLMEEANALQEKAASLMDELASPTERFAKKLKELDELKAKGMLTNEQYDRAVGEAAKQLDETAEAANRAHDAIQKVDAVLAGSAEATARVLEFKNMVREQRESSTGYKGQIKAQELLIKQGSSNLAGDKDVKQTEVLKRVEKLLEKYVKKPAVELKPAGAA